MRRFGVIGILLVGLASMRARGASEPLEAHTQRPLKIIVLDEHRLLPATLRMATGDALVFENHSVHAMRVSFVAPSDLRARVRCGLVRAQATDPEEAPWLLFAWEDKALVAVIPPGRFASVCSLQKGTYDFLAAHIGSEPRPEGGGGALPEKGEIVVE